MIELPFDRTPSQLKLYGSILEQLELDRIRVPELPPKLQFSREVKASPRGSGYVGNNRNFFLEVILPFVHQNQTVLRRLPIHRRLNALYLFVFLAYDAYFSDSALPGHFYRWGGDLFDIDEPTSDNIRTERAFGLDCSGYVASAIDIVARFDLGEVSEHSFLDERKKILADVPAGESSLHRLNVSDFAKVGREFFNERDEFDPDWEDQLRAGDFIVIPGHEKVFPHIVAIVQICGSLFVAESANNGSLTLDHFEKTGRLLSLEEAIGILKDRGIAYSVRSYLGDE